MWTTILILMIQPIFLLCLWALLKTLDFFFGQPGDEERYQALKRKLENGRLDKESEEYLSKYRPKTY